MKNLKECMSRRNIRNFVRNIDDVDIVGMSYKTYRREYGTIVEATFRCYICGIRIDSASDICDRCNIAYTIVDEVVSMLPYDVDTLLVVQSIDLTRDRVRVKLIYK